MNVVQNGFVVEPSLCLQVCCLFSTCLLLCCHSFLLLPFSLPPVCVHCSPLDFAPLTETNSMDEDRRVTSASFSTRQTAAKWQTSEIRLLYRVRVHLSVCPSVCVSIWPRVRLSVVWLC